MKVICIDDDFTEASKRQSFKYVNQLPECGVTYEVDEQIVHNGTAGLVLKEIFGGMHPNGELVSFKAKRFVPLSDEKLERVALSDQELSLINVN